MEQLKQVLFSTFVIINWLFYLFTSQMLPPCVSFQSFSPYPLCLWEGAPQP